MLWRVVFVCYLLASVAGEELKRLRFGANSYMNLRNATPTYRGPRWLPPARDGLNVIDGLRLFGMLYACCQLTFIIALVIRIYILDDIIDENDDANNIVKVTGPTGMGLKKRKKRKMGKRRRRTRKTKKMNKRMRKVTMEKLKKNKKAVVAILGRRKALKVQKTQDDDLDEINVEIDEKIARSVTAQEPTVELEQVSARGGSKFSIDSTQDSLDTTTSRALAKKSSIHKSSRLPRAPKGHQIGFLDRMEEILLNETEDDEEPVGGKKKSKEKKEGSAEEKTARRDSKEVNKEEPKENKESTVTMGSKDETTDNAATKE